MSKVLTPRNPGTPVRPIDLDRVRRGACYGLFLLSLVGSALSMTFLLVSLSIIPGRIADIATGHSSPTAQGASAVTSDRDGVSPGPSVQRDAEWSWLDWSRSIGGERDGFTGRLVAASKDLSAVTPFVLTLFFAFILIRVADFLFRGGLTPEKLQDGAETLPFSRNFETFWVQLGLIGTLAGLMIVGLGIKDLGDSKLLETLLASFLTALLSTFTAVVLAYVGAPLIIGTWKWIFQIREDPEDLSVTVNDLNRVLRETAQCVGDLQSALSLINRELKDFRDTGLTQSLGRIEKSLESFVAHGCKSKDVTDLGAGLAQARKEVSEDGKRVERAINSAQEALKGELTGIKVTLDTALTKGLAGLAGDLRTQDAEQRKLLSGIVYQIGEARKEAEERGARISQALRVVSYLREHSARLLKALARMLGRSVKTERGIAAAVQVLDERVASMASESAIRDRETQERLAELDQRLGTLADAWSIRKQRASGEAEVPSGPDDSERRSWWRRITG